ncbi:10229_t:CDS:2 [Acaulospora colombiana]|uniref:10229_t:CDS:1 n=1 Tax=Acaulospora colombiana TaxID=27376 RepID=A0ACA9MS92_9GLOM|nr:10229_t:CDS:2 [Acaulospora colombiana]
MVKRKYSDEEEFDVHPQPAVKRIAIRTEFPAQGQMDVEMDDMQSGISPHDSERSSPMFTGQSSIHLALSRASRSQRGPRAYPPTSQTLYPFPVKRDDMDCEDTFSNSPGSSSPINRASTDPVHGHVTNNRHPSNASSIAALQPRTRNTSCACPQIPKLILAQYANEEGKRTMWSHCEGCGAMDMVLGCDGQPTVLFFSNPTTT